MVGLDTKDFYVYKRIRLDNMSCFYVGKGRGRRYKVASRNEHHNRIAKKHGYKTIIVKSGLSEKEALELEKEIIRHYVFDLKYGIDVDGYRESESSLFLTNQTFGGDGTSGVRHTDEWKIQHSKKMSGCGNSMFGVNVFEKLPTEKQNKIREFASKRNSGENNPMFGISPRERMTPEKYAIWLEKQKSRNRCGKNNPNFGNKTLHNKIKDNPKLRLQYYSRPKEQNGRAREIYVYNKNNVFVGNFSYIGACAEWFKDFLKLKASVTSIRQSIITSITNNKLYHGYRFSYFKI